MDAQCLCCGCTVPVLWMFSAYAVDAQCLCCAHGLLTGAKIALPCVCQACILRCTTPWVPYDWVKWA